VLLISHRLAFAAFADHAIVMTENGAIREAGDPRELIARGGEFASLYRASIEELNWRDNATPA
jgi:ABC-type multidrug transport system fused ATPase/permease subunit